MVRAGDRLRVSGGMPRADLVRELVEAGYRVDSVDGRRQLEEVFLSLVGDAAERGRPWLSRGVSAGDATRYRSGPSSAGSCGAAAPRASSSC